jgi:hypothetical protein
MGKPFKSGINSVPTSRVNSKEGLIPLKSEKSRNLGLESNGEQSSRRSRIDRIKEAGSPTINSNVKRQNTEFVQKKSH